MEIPIAPDAEAGLLGSILLDSLQVMPKCIEREVSKDHFYDDRNRKVYETIQKMDFHKVDSISVSEKCAYPQF